MVDTLTPLNDFYGSKEMQTDINLNQSALDEWIDYRKAIKKPLKAPTINKLAKKLAAWDYDYQQEVVDYSIEQGWQGLYEPKKVNTNKTVTLTQEKDFIDLHTDCSWANDL